MSTRRGPFDRRLLEVVPTARGGMSVVAALGVLQGLAAVGIAVALTSLVVAVVRQEPLITPALWLAGLMLGRAAASWLIEVASARLATKVTDGLRESLTQHWLTRPEEAASEPATRAALVNQGVVAVEPYVTKYLPALVAGLVTPLVAVVALVVVDPISALIVVLTLPLLPFFAALIGAATAHESRRRWQTLADLSHHFLDVMKGLPTLVNYGRADRQTEVIASVSESHRKATMRTLRLAFMSSAALELLASLSVAIVAVAVGLRLTYGSMELWAGLLAILLAPEAYWPIRRVGAEFHAAADGVEALDQVFVELADESGADIQDVSRLEDAVAPRLALHDVSYRYPQATSPTFDGLTQEWGVGLHVITGPSGAGKTTLLESMAGLRGVDEGIVDAGSVHLVTARPFLPAGSLRDALTLGNDQADPALWEALHDVDLSRWVHELPAELDTTFGDDGFGMSAGQRARVVLARAILSDASVTLLDEPTAHLDGAAAEHVHALLQRIAKTRCVIAVTHQPGLMAIAATELALEAVS